MKQKAQSIGVVLSCFLLIFFSLKFIVFYGGVLGYFFGILFAVPVILIIMRRKLGFSIAKIIIGLLVIIVPFAVFNPFIQIDKMLIDNQFISLLSLSACFILVEGILFFLLYGLKGFELN